MNSTGPSPLAVARAMEHTLAEADAAGLGNTVGAQELAGRIAVLRAGHAGLSVDEMRVASRAARAARGG